LRYYPIFLDLRHKPVLVIGGGKVALRKARGLVEAGAEVTVVAPVFDAGFAALAVNKLERRFQTSDIGRQALVFAATNDRAVNAAAAEEAKRRGIPVNVADRREECDFLVPSRVTLSGAQIAISTEGESPRRAAVLRRAIEAALTTPQVKSD
jgi:siroheme synthase-like protein